MTPTSTVDGLAAALASLAQAPDRDAWAAIVDLVGDDIRNLTGRIAGAALADDAMQECLLSVRDHAGRFTPPPVDADAAARRWILRIAANAALMTLRTRRRALAREHAYAAAAEREHGDEQRDALEDREQAQSLRRELALLPAGSRDAIALHFLAELPLDAVAATLSLPVASTRQRINRGLLRMRQRLQRTDASAALPFALLRAPLPSGSAARWRALFDAPVKSVLDIPTIHGGAFMALKITLPIVTALAVCFVPVLRGQDKPAPVVAGADAVKPAADELWKRVINDKLEQRVTLDFQEHDFSDVTAWLQKITGINIVVDPTMIAQASPITLQVIDMRLRNVLTWITRMERSRWDLREEAIYVHAAGMADIAADIAAHVTADANGIGSSSEKADLDNKLAQRMSFDFQGQSFASVLAFFQTVTGANIIVDPAVLNEKKAAEITLKAKDMLFADALKWVCDLVDCRIDLCDQALFIRAKGVHADVAAVHVSGGKALSVVLGIGSAQGIAVGSEFSVTGRGCRLRCSAVDDQTATCDFLGDGSSVHVGDEAVMDVAPAKKDAGY